MDHKFPNIIKTKGLKKKIKVIVDEETCTLQNT